MPAEEFINLFDVAHFLFKNHEQQELEAQILSPSTAKHSCDKFTQLITVGNNDVQRDSFKYLKKFKIAKPKLEMKSSTKKQKSNSFAPFVYFQNETLHNLSAMPHTQRMSVFKKFDLEWELDNLFERIERPFRAPSLILQYPEDLIAKTSYNPFGIHKLEKFDLMQHEIDQVKLNAHYSQIVFEKETIVHCKNQNWKILAVTEDDSEVVLNFLFESAKVNICNSSHSPIHPKQDAKRRTVNPGNQMSDFLALRSVAIQDKVFQNNNQLKIPLTPPTILKSNYKLTLFVEGPSIPHDFFTFNLISLNVPIKENNFCVFYSENACYICSQISAINNTVDVLSIFKCLNRYHLKSKIIFFLAQNFKIITAASNFLISNFNRVSFSVIFCKNISEMVSFIHSHELPRKNDRQYSKTFSTAEKALLKLPFLSPPIVQLLMRKYRFEDLFLHSKYIFTQEKHMFTERQLAAKTLIIDGD